MVYHNVMSKITKDEMKMFCCVLLKTFTHFPGKWWISFINSSMGPPLKIKSVLKTGLSSVCQDTKTNERTQPRRLMAEVRYPRRPNKARKMCQQCLHGLKWMLGRVMKSVAQPRKRLVCFFASVFHVVMWRLFIYRFWNKLLNLALCSYHITNQIHKKIHFTVCTVSAYQHIPKSPITTWCFLHCSKLNTIVI